MTKFDFIYILEVNSIQKHLILIVSEIILIWYFLDPKSVCVGNVHLFNTGEGLVPLQGPLYAFPD